MIFLVVPSEINDRERVCRGGEKRRELGPGASYVWRLRD